MKQRNLLSITMLRYSGILLLILSSLAGSAQICSPANISNAIYGLTNAGDIHRITVSTGAVGTKINPVYPGNPANLSNGIGYNTLNGKFYYFKRSPDVAPQEFVSFEPTTNTVTVLSSCPATSSINVGCVNHNGSGYYCWDQAGVLFYYDISSNTWTTITSVIRDQLGNDVSAVIQANVSGDVAVDAAGTLIMVLGGNSQYALYKLFSPPKTPVASVTVARVIPLTNNPAGQKLVGVALNSTGQILVMTANPGNRIYRLESNLTFTLLSTISTGMGDITSCNYPLFLLPGSLKDFSLKETDGKVLLTWEDKDKQGVNGYSIEHSINSNDWSEVGFVKANYYSTGLYSFRHSSPIKGRNYYRVRIVSINEEADFSATKVIDLQSGGHFSIWPNPVENRIIIQHAAGKVQSGNIMVVDLSGRAIQHETLIAGKNTIDVARLTAGSYFLRIQYADGENYMKRFVKK